MSGRCRGGVGELSGRSWVGVSGCVGEGSGKCAGDEMMLKCWRRVGGNSLRFIIRIPW